MKHLIEVRYANLVEELKGSFDKCDTLLCKLIARETPRVIAFQALQPQKQPTEAST